MNPLVLFLLVLQTFFKTPLTVDQMKGKQAVIETAAGTIILQLLPEAAPNHVGHFIKTAQEGGYNGTTFHRMIKYGIIQGGDPLSKDPARSAQYGTGGLGVLRMEKNAEKHTRGAVSAVLQPGKPDSAGNQFFICFADQPALDGQYTVFARVVEGLSVVQRISETPADEGGKAKERVVISKVTIRDTPAEEPEPFSTESPADLAKYRAVLETSRGAITVSFLPDVAPGHVRNFLRLAQAGVYDGTSFHRVVPGFVVQGGMTSTRREPLGERQQKYVRNLAPEFNDTPHDAGTLSMARLDDPNSASTSFFICVARTPALDRVYTAFGRVVSGMEVVEAIEKAPRNGEAPVERIELIKVRLEKP